MSWGGGGAETVPSGNRVGAWVEGLLTSRMRSCSWDSLGGWQGGVGLPGSQTPMVQEDQPACLASLGKNAPHRVLPVPSPGRSLIPKPLRLR